MRPLYLLSFLCLSSPIVSLPVVSEAHNKPVILRKRAKPYSVVPVDGGAAASASAAAEAAASAGSSVPLPKDEATTIIQITTEVTTEVTTEAIATVTVDKTKPATTVTVTKSYSIVNAEPSTSSQIGDVKTSLTEPSSVSSSATLISFSTPDVIPISEVHSRTSESSSIASTQISTHAQASTSQTPLVSTETSQLSESQQPVTTSASSLLYTVSTVSEPSTHSTTVVSQSYPTPSSVIPLTDTVTTATMTGSKTSTYVTSVTLETLSQSSVEPETSKPVVLSTPSALSPTPMISIPGQLTSISKTTIGPITSVTLIPSTALETSMSTSVSNFGIQPTPLTLETIHTATSSIENGPETTPCYDLISTLPLTASTTPDDGMWHTTWRVWWPTPSTSSATYPPYPTGH